MALVLLLFMGSWICCAKDVILLRGKRAYLLEDEEIRSLVEYYGLKLNTVDVASEAASRVMSQLSSPETLAVITSSDALSGLDRKRIQAALQRRKQRSVPVFVFGVEAYDDANELKLWSGGMIQACTPLSPDFQPKVVEVGNVREVSRTLTGSELPAVTSPTCVLRFEPASVVQTLLAARGDHEANAVLIRARAPIGEVFISPKMKPLALSWVGKKSSLPEAFSSMAPFIMFLDYVTGDYGWHLDGHYANLTIDDAWLTRAYGHLDYEALLAEMQKHNFHTTIAFIPWNFDRSKRDIIAIFRAHPERFSVSVHGNDHKHREFGDYSRIPLVRQIVDIKQGVARMERFQALTGIHYDRFMVFPHGVAPEETFAVLKTYNFLGTANSEIVPLGAAFPSDPSFLLRPYTVAYANLLSLSRQAPGQTPRSEIAIQAFLGNPQLYYGHEDLFTTSIGAFNELADTINRASVTEWTSLGEIARHSHLVRRRNDSAFDVRMFSNEMELKNPTDRDAVFYIERKEGLSPVIQSLTVDGAPATFERSNNRLTIRLLIHAQQVRIVRVLYRNDMNQSGEDIRKRNVYAYALRLASDVRDLYLSKFSWGLVIKRAYYRYGWDSIELYLERKWLAGIAVLGLACAGLWYRSRMARKRTVREQQELA